MQIKEDYLILFIISTTFEEGKTHYNDATVSALFNTGRPVLLVPPHHHFDDITKLNVIIAWNGSTEAMRAVTLSLPLLQHVKNIYVLTIQDEDIEEDSYFPISSEDLSLYLKQYDINVDLLKVCDSSAVTTEEILKNAKEKNADMVIMGAYSHNKLWETFFGGVTDFMLKNTPIPLFMSH